MVVGVGGASSNSGLLVVCCRRVTRVTGGSLVGRRLWRGARMWVVVVIVVVLVLVVGRVRFVALVCLSRLMVAIVGAWAAVVVVFGATFFVGAGVVVAWLGLGSWWRFVVDSGGVLEASDQSGFVPNGAELSLVAKLPQLRDRECLVFSVGVTAAGKPCAVIVMGMVLIVAVIVLCFWCGALVVCASIVVLVHGIDCVVSGAAVDVA